MQTNLMLTDKSSKTNCENHLSLLDKNIQLRARGNVERAPGSCVKWRAGMEKYERQQSNAP